MKDIERRVNGASEIRATPIEDGSPPKIVGYAAVFDSLSEDLGGFRERIAPFAFKRTLESADVRALWNHDPNFILGRNKAGTLSLMEDAHGLHVQILPPETQFARDLMESIRRGDVTGMSFGFRTLQDNWEKIDDAWVRTLVDVTLYDASVVSYPAYPQTDVAVRAMNAWREQNPTSPWRLALARRRLDLISN